MDKSLIRSNQLGPDISGLVGVYGSGFFASKDSITVISGDFENTVRITGNETISGEKSFVGKTSIGSSTGSGVLELQSVPDGVNAIYFLHDGETGLSIINDNNGGTNIISGDNGYPTILGNQVSVPELSIRNTVDNFIYADTLNITNSDYSLSISDGAVSRLTIDNMNRAFGGLNVLKLSPSTGTTFITIPSDKVDGSLLAIDQEVAHVTGNETISGAKNFLNDTNFQTITFDSGNSASPLNHSNLGSAYISANSNDFYILNTGRLNYTSGGNIIISGSSASNEGGQVNIFAGNGSARSGSIDIAGSICSVDAASSIDLTAPIININTTGLYSNNSGIVVGSGIKSMVRLTQNQYNVLGTKDPLTFYVIIG